MKLWSTLIRFDVNLRKVMAVYLFIPLFAVALPVVLWNLAQSYSAYLALADRGVQTVASIQKIAETGGRGVSTGIAVWKRRSDPDETLRQADQELYRSKATRQATSA